MKKVLTALLGTGLFLVSGAAAAQYGGGSGWSGTYQPTAPPVRSSGLDNLGEEAQLTFGVDRVMGVAFNRTKVEPEGGGEIIVKSTNVYLFGNPGGSASDATTGASAPNLFVPRLALDYFVMESLSVGGSFLYASSSGEIDTDAGSADLADTTTLGFAPRVGYCMAFDETFSIWPRLGITYFSSKTESDAATTTVSGLDLTLEGMVGISPFSNFAMLVGPYVDFGLSGTAENDPDTGPSTEADAKTTSYGLSVSILGYY